jgi:hypothetical protein
MWVVRWLLIVGHACARRYKVLAQQTKEDARCAFMRILRTLPYGNATFFAVRRIGKQPLCEARTFHDAVKFCCMDKNRPRELLAEHCKQWVSRMRGSASCACSTDSSNQCLSLHLTVVLPGICQDLRLLLSIPAAEDPIGLLPPRLILGINKRGVHFFRPVPKEYLHSAELRDIMQVRGRQ